MLVLPKNEEINFTKRGRADTRKAHAFAAKPVNGSLRPQVPSTP